MIRAVAALLAVLASPAVAQQPELRPKPARACPAVPAAAGGASNAHTAFIEARLPLAARMAALEVPGVSVAVVRDGQIDWARGWGVRDVETCAPVTADTRFQAASISKPVTAAVALRLAARGTIDLDAPVERYLARWRLPADPAHPGDVTVRRLLSHTAGTTIHGFPGYAADAALPTLAQILDGAAPANTAPVRLQTAPGTHYAYSGGGYEIVQMALEDASGEPFAPLAAETVLAPLGMTKSAFAQPPDADIIAAAASAHAAGRVMTGRFRTYPELAAAGLWTTPSDLARFFAALRGSAGFIDAGTMLAPVAPGYGLGMELAGEGASRRFGHSGANAGFRAVAWFLTGGADGVVVMTNAESGGALAGDIIRAVAADYGWDWRG